MDKYMEEIIIESGRGKNSEVPSEIKRWNWGAFLFNWIWGIGNSTYIALLMFLPIANMVMPFVLGAKGNQWAWQNRTWRDVDHFKKTQKKWAISGLLFYLVFIPLFMMPLMGMMKGEAYDLSLVNIQANEEVMSLIGEPMKPGYFVTGSVSTSGPKGQASLQYSISGPNGKATAIVYAFKELGEWKLHQVVVLDKQNQKQIHVVTPELK